MRRLALPRSLRLRLGFAEAGLCSARRVPGSERGTAASLATRLGFALAGQPYPADGGDEGRVRQLTAIVLRGTLKGAIFS
jgi:hypothetical protein